MSINGWMMGHCCRPWGRDSSGSQFLYKILATVMRWGLPCQSVIRVWRLVELCGVDTTGEMEQFVFGAGIGPPWEPGGVLCIIGVPPGGYIIPV